jgi:hypothetical protein
MSFEPLNFELIKDDERSVLNTDTRLDILDLFETAINSSSYPDIDEKATRFVTDLVAFAAKSRLRTGVMSYATWKVLINIASCIPYRHYGQDVLVKIVSLLGAADTWKDDPGFGMAMRDEWNRSMYSMNSSFETQPNINERSRI